MRYNVIANTAELSCYVIDGEYLVSYLSIYLLCFYVSLIHVVLFTRKRIYIYICSSSVDFPLMFIVQSGTSDLGTGYLTRTNWKHLGENCFIH